jgi:hypothetical protein
MAVAVGQPRRRIPAISVIFRPWVALERSAPVQPAVILNVVLRRCVHQAAVVPDEQIMLLPSVAVDEPATHGRTDTHRDRDRDRDRDRHTHTHTHTHTDRHRHRHTHTRARAPRTQSTNIVRWNRALVANFTNIAMWPVVLRRGCMRCHLPDQRLRLTALRSQPSYFKAFVSEGLKWLQSALRQSKHTQQAA